MEITENKQWITLGDKANNELILEGEAYSNFAKSLRSPHTMKTYVWMLRAFMKYKNFTTTSQLLEGEPKPIQSTIIDYILHFKEEKILSSQSLAIATKALKHFYDMNDIILNWKKINSFIGIKMRTVKDRAYTRDEIRKILEKCDEH
jgi:site-specific recombinase XerC